MTRWSIGTPKRSSLALSRPRRLLLPPARTIAANLGTSAMVYYLNSPRSGVMDLREALGLGEREIVALVGGGGKTTAMYRLCRETAARGGKAEPVHRRG